MPHFGQRRGGQHLQFGRWRKSGLRGERQRNEQLKSHLSPPTPVLAENRSAPSRSCPAPHDALAAGGGGSMPLALMVATASGVCRNLRNSSAASACFAPLTTPPANIVMFCRSPGNGPTRSVPCT